MSEPTFAYTTTMRILPILLVFVVLSNALPLSAQQAMFNVNPDNRESGNILDLLSNPVNQVPNPFEKISENIDALMPPDMDLHNRNMVELSVGRMTGMLGPGAGTVPEGDGPLAVEGPLVVEEDTAGINQGILEPIDPDTRMYTPRLSVDFREFPRVRETPAVWDRNLDRLAKHLKNRLRLAGPITVERKGETVVLRGTVATEREARLIEVIARTTPGVDQLRNELAVAGIAPVLDPPR